MALSPSKKLDSKLSITPMKLRDEDSEWKSEESKEPEQQNSKLGFSALKSKKLSERVLDSVKVKNHGTLDPFIGKYK